MANNLGKGKTKTEGASATRIISKGNFVTLRARLGTKGESLYLDFSVNGKRKYEFLHLTLTPAKTPLDKQVNKETLALAEQVKAQRDLELSSNQHGFVPSHKKKTNFIDFIIEGSTKRNNKNTKNRWLRVAEMAKDYHQGDMLPFSSVTQEWLQGFKEYLLEQLESTNSAKAYFATLSCAVREGLRARIITVDPLLNVKNIAMEERLTEYHTLEEVKKLAKEPVKPKHETMKRAYLFGCLTGMRVSDIFALQWNRVQVEKLPTGIMEYRIKFIQKKVTDAVYLPISEEAYNLLGSPKTSNGQERVFDLSYNLYLTKNLRAWVQAAKIDKKIGWHTARHTHAILLLTSGADIYTVSKRLGHSSISVTEKYLHIIDKKMSEAANIIRLFSE